MEKQLSSLDPRVNRLPAAGTPGIFDRPFPLDQFGTFEVFVQPKAGKPFQHEGAVHAPDPDMAFILAKETFTRRFTCVSLCIADTRNIHVSPITEADQNLWDLLKPSADAAGKKGTYEIYFLPKRGKQHVHAGSIVATSADAAMLQMNEEFTGRPVQNLWAINKADILFTSAEESDFWATLPDKKFRDAAAYKGGDRLKDFVERNSSTQP